MDNMPGMTMSPPTTTTQMMNTTSTMQMGLSHMTFYWGKNSEILFSDWPGTRTGMYVLALFVVFFLSILVEWLSSCLAALSSKTTTNDSAFAGLTRTLLHGIRVGLAYLVMLALMSFNVGVLLMAILGHSLGYFFFISGVFFKSNGVGKGYATNHSTSGVC